ncbi:hypothetical protein AVEN_4938-1 [Araneus ventricosus]|uniref:Uncharacterized protein n=1 Tax=Araneus ventricosus TaxID=182803 RepID=A0A4Y2E8K5_ARAVE|nr:hypothetical protein AVEN_4938-1 [Araneus ventricosus]
MIHLRQIDYEFVCLLEMCFEVLVKLDCTNKSLQGSSATIDVAPSLLSGLAKNIQHLREEEVHKHAAKAKDVCDSMSIKRSFTIKRLRKVKRMAGEMVVQPGQPDYLIGLLTQFFSCFFPTLKCNS